MTFKPSKYQQAIYDWVCNGQGNAIIQAVAGSGKTSTIVAATNLLPTNKQCLFVAFNKSIADELKTKVPSHVQARTLHSLGLGFFRYNTGKMPQIDSDKVNNIIESEMDENLSQTEKAEYITFLRKIVPLIKNMLVDYTNLEQITDVMAKYNIEFEVDDEAMILIKRIIVKNNSITHTVDYDDMIYLPVVNNFKCNTYDWVFVDECLPGATRILFSNGKNISIKKIVEQKLSSSVISFNKKSNMQENKKIVGWSKIPIGNKKMMKITFARRYSDYYKIQERLEKFKQPYHVLFCTDNHKIFTQRGYIEASKLLTGDKIQFELSHGNNNLKINTDGRIKKKFFEENGLCHICGKICKSTNSLGSHLRVHTEYQGNKVSENGHITLSENAKKRNLLLTADRRKDIGRKISEKMSSGIIPVRFGGYTGNGYPTKQQLLLFNELIQHDDNWKLEYSIPTQEKRGTSYPTNYKVDLALPEHKLAIEVNGKLHTTKTMVEKDKKKIEFLNKKDWLVISFWNDEIDNNIQSCVEKTLKSLIGRSPEFFEITNIEEVKYTEEYVYDIEVEDNHNFYAEGVLVHNCQDLNRAQFELIKKVCNGHTRVVTVGDRRQSIYSFRGADTKSMDNFQAEFRAKELPLSICYRCPKSHILLAQAIVPEIECAETAIEGTISHKVLQDAILQMQEKDLVLCRTNAPLIKVAFAIIRSGKKAVVRGRDIGKNLLKLIEKYKADNLGELYLKLNNYQKLQQEKLDLIERGKYDKKKKNSILANIDSVETITAIMEDCQTIDDVRLKISTIFSDEKEGIVCSSVHRAKGFEADNVFIINRDNMPHPMAKTDEEIEQEMNILYVALTRSKNELCIIKGVVK